METIEPGSLSTGVSADLLEREDGTEPVLVVPPVVAVVVARNRDTHLEATLAALSDQDYPALSVLVLDAGGDGAQSDLTARVAAAMPKAFIRRCEGPDGSEPGFATAANEALVAVEGAMFLLFCTDEITPDPDAVRALVEEAYRSNAAIVGPKIVDEDRPDILVEVGMAVDHYGVPFSGIEPEEVDQQQHDAVRDVFFVSHTAMLVRSDLFHELSGFDPQAFPGADDVDLCWRARLAGARVIVAPTARVRRHTDPVVVDESTELAAETRSRVRVLCKSYSSLALLWVLPVAFVLAAGEALGLVLSGRPRLAAGLARGWLGAFAHPLELHRARRETQRLRRVDDGDVRELMIHGSAQVRTLVTHRLHTRERIADVSTRTRERMQRASSQARRAPAVIGMVLAALLLFGSRWLLFAHVPEVVQFRAWPGVSSAWSTFTGAWRTTFLGSAHPATPGFGMMSVFSAVLLGHTALARSLVVGAALPLGAWGAYRLVRPFASSALPPVAAAVAYAANPVARNAIWRGELGPLVCFALAPFILSAVVRASDPDTDQPVRHHATITIALLATVAAAAWPPAFLFVPLIAIAFVVASPFSRELGVGVRAAVVAGAASLVALLLCTPWVWSLFGADAATLGMQPRDALSLSSVLHFHTGRAGAGIASWGIVAAAFVPLAIATGPRLAWATRAWMLAAGSFAIAWLPGRLDSGASVPATEGVLVGAAIGLAFAAGLGVAAVLDDLHKFHFGWRQVMTVVATVGLVLALVGFAADTVSGRYGLSDRDWPSTVAWMHANPPAGGFRVMWVGDPTILPADAKPAGDTGFALTRDGAGDARAMFAAPESSADSTVARAIASAEAGHTARLGHLLAPAGVRYIAFITRAAPDSGPNGRPQPRLADALAHQVDLTLSRTDTNGVVYQNDAWIPMHAIAGPLVGNEALLSDSTGVEGVSVHGGRTEPTGPGTLLWSEAANSGWHASAAGKSVPRHDAFGTTNAFALDTHARVQVSFHGSSGPNLLRTFAILAWIVVALAWFGTRRRMRAVRGMRA
jgi:GT2 family glycosyltransferase